MNEEKIIDCSLCMFCSRTISHKNNEYFCGLSKSNPNDFYGKVIADQKQWKTEYDGMKFHATDMYVCNVRECSSFYQHDRNIGLHIADVTIDPIKLRRHQSENYSYLDKDNTLEVQPGPFKDGPAIKLNPISIFLFLMAFMYAGIIFYLATSYDPESFIHIFGIFVSTIGVTTFIALFIKSFKKSK